ncbi:hypothetical protein [Aureibacter tunicatorum]|uniref:Endonuclease n=1 Tax=Aureibacter tunicatorum TaxID=866807 RepID=A0AAE3XN29_9BACT|nr:hypothetical protein [Aureibacter tunicatorum]MDR6239987.1 hypothetical protein [Aureibacter tunicatorum]BDD04459.1 endonuclease [Aureibacter tunicatorum]
MAQKQNRYQLLIEDIFFSSYKKGVEEITFHRDDLIKSSKKLGINLPKNLGDVIYAVRYRIPLPQSILDTQTKGREWIIEGKGRAKYCFKLVKINRILPNSELVTIKIPDSTPEIVTQYSLSDEQALLAKIRYNRLIDIFLNITTYSLQNHLRTTVQEVGQIEIDEIYVGIDDNGRHFVIPVQAKGGSDQLSVVQTSQDIKLCSEKYSDLICRAISAQFMEDDLIALFELTIQDNQIKVAKERHYKLVTKDEIGTNDLELYKTIG